jgi:hypothetical protein
MKRKIILKRGKISKMGFPCSLSIWGLEGDCRPFTSLRKRVRVPIDSRIENSSAELRGVGINICTASTKAEPQRCPTA